MDFRTTSGIGITNKRKENEEVPILTIGKKPRITMRNGSVRESRIRKDIEPNLSVHKNRLAFVRWTTRHRHSCRPSCFSLLQMMNCRRMCVLSPKI